MGKAKASKVRRQTRAKRPVPAQRANTKSRTVGAYEAKTHLPRILADVEAGAEISISRNGRPIAVISKISAKIERPVEDVIRELHDARAGVRLGDLSIEDLKKTGRR